MNFIIWFYVQCVLHISLKLFDLILQIKMEIEHVYSSDESTTESEPSRLITEEDYLDMLFFSCDVFKTGKVDVSTLIEYLRFTTSSVAEVGSVSNSEGHHTHSFVEISSKIYKVHLSKDYE